jgi:UDP-glucuronate 4-epimerase
MRRAGCAPVRPLGAKDVIRVAESFMVTGSLGCIGAWVVRLLVREGTPVVSLDAGNDLHRPRLLLSPEEMDRVPWVKGDITDLAGIEQVLDEHQVTNVIHLAALQMPFCKANPPLGAAVNVLGTVNTLEAARRRADRVAPVVYAGSMAMFSAGDVDPETGLLPLDAVPHPLTHYGVDKQANEGNARLYWLEHGLPSVGLRPMAVLGPGRDQGMTSGPTKAILAAVIGRPFAIPFGGVTLYNYAADVARACLVASRTPVSGALVANLPGSRVDMPEVVATIDAVIPGSGTGITFGDQTLPFPSGFEVDPLSPLPPLEVTPFEEAVRATADLFRSATATGHFRPEEHGLPAS